MQKRKLLSLFACLAVLALSAPFYTQAQTPAPAAKPAAKSAAKQAAALEGTWQGTLTAPNGIKLRIVFEITRDAKGTYNATLTSVDQGGAKLPVESTELKDGQVTMSLPAIMGSYAGKLASNELTGTWSQGGSSVPLNLTRDAAAPATTK
ncbi:MAG TPA: hypothetical protein VMH83_13540 [Candidatus Acidoferrum sp.]|nr:hypothetical protein [Candidatus Acidoferrum sp.]